MTDTTLNLSGRPTGASADHVDDQLVVDTTTENFVAEVLDESKRRPVLVDFWAPWCGPCRTLSPIIESAVHAAKGRVKLAKMNIDDHPAIPGQLGIQSIPAVIAFVDGKPADGFVGAIPESEVKAFIDKIAGPSDETSDVEASLEQADQALNEGSTQRAAELYAAVHQSDNEDVRALAGLARASLAAGDIERAKQMLALTPPTKAGDPVIAAAKAEIELAEQSASLGDPAELAARIEANPGDYAARLDLALVNNTSGDRAAAAAQLLAVIRADREWDDERARKQLLQFFEVWGPTDEATLTGRRQLSSLLFS